MSTRDHEVERLERASQPAARSACDSTGLPAIVTSARIWPSPGVSISSARHATGSSPKTSGSPRTRLCQRPSCTPRPVPGLAAACSAAPAAAFGEHRAARAVEVAGEHVERRRRASSRACRTPACRCRCARRPRRARRPASSRAIRRMSSAGDPAGRARRASGVNGADQLARPASSPSTCSASAPGSTRPSAKSTLHQRERGSSASVPGRMKWCSSASSAVRLRRGSITTTLPPRSRIAAQPAAHVGRGHQAAVRRERVGAEHQQVVGAVDVGDRDR